MANDLRALAQAFTATGNDLGRVIDEAGERVARATAVHAQRLSSGAVSSRSLGKADHPYARRHGSPRLDPAIINRQTGLFQASWQVETVVTPSGRRISVLRNTAPQADFLEKGTRTMFARPLGVRLQAFAEQEWERIAPDLIKATLSRHLSR